LDPDPDPSFIKRLKTLKKCLKVHIPYILACHLQIVADPDPDPAYHFDADPDTDPAYHFDADPNPEPWSVCRPTVADSHHFDEEQDPHPDPH
jgi:hypothetical protein